MESVNSFPRHIAEAFGMHVPLLGGLTVNVQVNVGAVA
jgi:hypothetical protein